MFTWMWIFGIALCGAAGPRRALAAQPNITTCEEFERGARFNPYAVIDSMWKIFYFWADNSELYPIIFALPAKKRLLKFKETIDSIDPSLGVEWDKATLFMNPRPGTEVLFIYSGTPGAFRAIITKQQTQKVRPYPAPHIKFADVRMKLEGKYLGMVCCEDLSAYALVRMDDNLPVTETHCQYAAAKLGLRGPGGQSYLQLKKRIEDEL